MFKYEKLGDGLVYYRNVIEDPYKIIEDIESLNDRVVKDIADGVKDAEHGVAKPWQSRHRRYANDCDKTALTGKMHFQICAHSPKQHPVRQTIGDWLAHSSYRFVEIKRQRSG